MELIDDGSTAPSTNLSMDSFQINAEGEATVSYGIAGGDSPPFTIGIYARPTGRQTADLLQTYEVDDPALLTGGETHTATFDADLTLLDDGNPYLIAKLDALDEVYETTKSDNRSAPLSGAFKTSDGTLYALADPAVSHSGSVGISQDPAGDISVALGGGPGQTFQQVSQISVTVCNGLDNAITVDSTVTVPVTIDGGSGSDTIVDNGSGDDTITAARPAAIRFTPARATTRSTAEVGRPAAITISDGGAGNDTIYAGDGGDYILGGSGNNEIYGGAGYDTLDGSAGQNNWIQAGSGGGLITGGGGNDWLYAGSGGTTTIDGGPGSEVIHGGAGTNYLNGGSGLDEIYGGTGTNFIDGNGVHDLLQGGSGKNYILPDPNPCAAWPALRSKGANGQPSYAGGTDAIGNPYVPDDQAVYSGEGGSVDWTFGSSDSGVRLGETQPTPRWRCTSLGTPRNYTLSGGESLGSERGVQRL